MAVARETVEFCERFNALYLARIRFLISIGNACCKPGEPLSKKEILNSVSEILTLERQANELLLERVVNEILGEFADEEKVGPFGGRLNRIL